MTLPPNQQLRTALLAAGVPPQDAGTLAAHYADADVVGWLGGLQLAARLVDGCADDTDLAALPEPWAAICANLTDPDQPADGQEILDAIADLPAAVQCALTGAIAGVLAAQTQQAQQAHASVGGAPTATQAAQAKVKAQYLAPIDPALIQQIQAFLAAGGNPNKNRKRAGQILIQWLDDHGRFIRTPQGQRYYLWRDEHRVFRLGTDVWHAWLYKLTASNPASADFRFFAADCETAAHDGEALDVVRLSHWDDDTQTLRVSRFDGYVYRLDGDSITLEANGEGPALFEDDPRWRPYEPDYDGAGDCLRWITTEAPHWDGDAERLGMLFRTWWLSTFFTELCPTRVILVLRGEKGSGKSYALRSLLHLTFGQYVDVVGVPDKQDAFTALFSNNHIVALDNFDDAQPWMRDKLASISTGKEDQVRQLYTTNEMQRIVYRCWLAVTARTPDTFQRDDIADRIMILPMERLPDSKRVSEISLRRFLLSRRNSWWGDVLVNLNAIVAHIRQHGLPARGGLRIEDWAALGSVAAGVAGGGDWQGAVSWVAQQQRAFLLDSDVILEGIDAWVSSVVFDDQWRTGRQLYEACGKALYGLDKPESSWPRSAKSFGRRIAGVWREMEERLQAEGVFCYRRNARAGVEYRFERVP